MPQFISNPDVIQSAQFAHKDAALIKVADLMSDGRCRTVNDVNLRLGMKRADAGRHLRKLLRQGVLHRQDMKDSTGDRWSIFQMADKCPD